MTTAIFRSKMIVDDWEVVSLKTSPAYRNFWLSLPIATQSAILIACSQSFAKFLTPLSCRNVPSVVILLTISKISKTNKIHPAGNQKPPIPIFSVSEPIGATKFSTFLLQNCENYHWYHVIHVPACFENWKNKMSNLIFLVKKVGNCFFKFGNPTSLEQGNPTSNCAWP